MVEEFREWFEELNPLHHVVNLRPVTRHLEQQFPEIPELGGFHDKTVRTIFVSSSHVRIESRGAEDHHRNAFELRVGAKFGQHFQTTHARQVQIEQHKIGFAAAPVSQLLECRFAVAGVVKVKAERLEAAPYQVRMVGVVFGKEYPRCNIALGSRGVGHGIRLRLA